MSEPSSIFSSLNPEQQEAVRYRGGPLLILAGAGSGKTRVLTHRIAYYIHQGALPFQILAVTFTNKAADVMRQRINALVNCRVPVGTFHSVCLQILRSEAALLNYPRGFTVYDEQDQHVIVKECMQELGVNPEHMSAKGVLEAIGRAKDELLTPDEYMSQAQDRYATRVAEIYTLYQKTLFSLRGMDFGDLLMQTVLLFQNREELLKVYQERYRHIFVDEYQDTNHAQYRFITLLAHAHRDITVVGDPDQSIYAWRGADMSNILDFESEFKDTQVVKLEQNYRSTNNILEAANELIRHNRRRKEKKLWSARGEGEPLSLYEAVDERDEAGFVAEKVLAYLDRKRSLRNMVVFYRVHALSRVLEDTLRAHDINYKIVGGVRFYDRREIKDLMAYLRVINLPGDSLSLRRIINVPVRGLGKKGMDLLEKAAEKKNGVLYEILKPAQLPGGLSNKCHKALEEFYRFIEHCREKLGEWNITELMRIILEKTGYIDILERERTMEAKIRIENIHEFFSAIEEFECDWAGTDTKLMLNDFLERLSLTTDIDRWDENADALTLMTLHSAKGLEFPIVFMVGMEEGLCPHVNAQNSLGDELEEERRLCYVGITRAQDRVHLSYANSRLSYGQRLHPEPSRFLGEIPRALIEYEGSGTRWPGLEEALEEELSTALDEESKNKRAIRHEHVEYDEDVESSR